MSLEESTVYCTRCGSPLIKLTETVIPGNNELFPITKHTYQCSNKKCQEEMDQKKAADKIVREERAKKFNERQEASKLMRASKSKSQQ